MWWKIALSNHVRVAEYSYGEYFYDPQAPELHEADIDTGDQSHDMVAQEHLINHMGYDLESPDDNWGYPLSYLDASKNFNNHVAGYRESPGSQYDSFAQINNPRIDEDGEYTHDLNDYLTHTWQQQRPEGVDPQVHAEQGASHLYGLRRRPREHMIKNFGWIKISGRNVQVESVAGAHGGWRHVADALRNAYDPDPSEKFTIHVMAQGNSGQYNSVPFWVIEEGSVAKWARSAAHEVTVSDF